MTRFLVAAVMLALIPAAAAAQAVCGPRDQVVERLETAYGEARVGLGIGRNTGVVEIFASPATGTWTILLTSPMGVTCMMAAGEAWESVAPVKSNGPPT